MTYATGDFVEVSTFTRQTDGQEVVIGRPETGVFLALPADVLEILDQLAAGKSVAAVQEEYARAHGVTPDVADLLECLEEKGFVRHRLSGAGPSAKTPPRAAVPAAPKVRYHFANIPVTTARRFFGPTAVCVYLSISLLGLLVAVFYPSIVPRASSLYFPRHQTAKLLLLVSLTYLTVFIHEFCHLLAARAVGVQSRIGISNRLWSLVAETDMTGLWAVPRSQRYLPILAGPLSDCVFASLILLCFFARSQGLIAMTSAVKEMAAALFFSYLLRLIWQFFFFVRTDIYFLIANVFGCKSMMKDTKVFLRNQVARLLGRPPGTDQSHIPATERYVIRSYSFLWLIGRGFAFYTLFFVTLPVTGRYLTNTFASIRRGFAASPYQFIDTIVVSAVSLFPFVLGMTLWLVSLLKRRSV